MRALITTFCLIQTLFSTCLADTGTSDTAATKSAVRERASYMLSGGKVVPVDMVDDDVVLTTESLVRDNDSDITTGVQRSRRFSSDPFREWQSGLQQRVISGEAIKAIAVATRHFETDDSHGRRPDILGFDVSYKETSHSIYVAFHPRLIPGDAIWTFGGSTGAGAYIAYEIDSATWEVKRHEYAE